MAGDEVFEPSRRFPKRIGGYPLPNCHQSEDGRRVLHDLDLVDMSDEDRWIEMMRVRRAYAAAYGKAVYVRTDDTRMWILADEWLRHRLNLLESAVRSQRGRRCSA